MLNVKIYLLFSQIFYPETTDIYDKKNMPRVIYCIHALRYEFSITLLANIMGGGDILFLVPLSFVSSASVVVCVISFERDNY